MKASIPMMCVRVWSKQANSSMTDQVQAGWAPHHRHIRICAIVSGQVDVGAQLHYGQFTE